MKDYYGILGVSPAAHAADIKRAYRRLAIQYHPDKNPSSGAEALIKDVNEAYDVLGDPAKRALYDQRLQNPWQELVQPEPEWPPQPAYRDPAYRRSSGRRPAPGSGKPTLRESMAYYLPYFFWLNYVGLAITMLLAVDYYLPYHHFDEKVVDGYAVRTRRGAHVYTILVTETGKHVKFYEPALGRIGTTMHIERTLIFRTDIAASFDDRRQTMGYIYSTLLFFPVIVFLLSGLALKYRQRVEFAFNVSVTTGILLIITLWLIL